MPAQRRVVPGQGPFRSKKVADDFPEQRGLVRTLLTQGVAVDTVSQRLSLPVDYVAQHSADIVGRRTMNRRQYWDDEVRSAVKLYVSLGPAPEYTEQRHYIYTKHIHPALTKMAELVVMTRSRGRLHNESKRGLIDQLVSDTYPKLDKYDITRDTNSFGYFNTAMGNAFTQISMYQGVQRRTGEKRAHNISLDADDTARYVLDEVDRSLHVDDEPSLEDTVGCFISDTLNADVPLGAAEWINTGRGEHKQRIRIFRVKQTLRLFQQHTSNLLNVGDRTDHGRVRPSLKTFGMLVRKEFKALVCNECGLNHSSYYKIIADIQHLFEAWNAAQQKELDEL